MYRNKTNMVNIIGICYLMGILVYFVIIHRILRLKKDQVSTRLKIKEPPQSFLEADWAEVQENRLPSEVIYMLGSVK